MNVGVEHTCPFLFSLGLQPMEWCRQQLGWVGQSTVISLILVLPHTHAQGLSARWF